MTSKKKERWRERDGQTCMQSHGQVDGRTDGETESKENKEDKRWSHSGYIWDVRKFWQYPRANGSYTKIGNEIGQRFEKYGIIQRKPSQCHFRHRDQFRASSETSVSDFLGNTLSFRTPEKRMQCGRFLPAQLHDIPWPYKSKSDGSVTFTQVL